MLIEIPIPYNLTQDQLQVNALDVATFNPDDDLYDLVAEIEAHEMPRIMCAAVCLHEHTRHPFMECVQQAIVWERG